MVAEKREKFLAEEKRIGLEALKADRARQQYNREHPLPENSPKRARQKDSSKN
jgi:hypothetical protein